jgi:hypothetical protein
MKAYTVKNSLWAIIIALVLIISLTACSSAPKVTAEKPQYCYTSQTIVTKDGERVQSKTIVECTDDQFKRLTAVRMGMSDHCGISNRTVQSGDKLVNVQIKSCQILDHNGNVVGYEYVN